MTQTAREFENTFATAWTLLLRNPLIIVACIVAGLLAAGAEYAVLMTMDSYAISGNGSRDALEAIRVATEIVLFVVSLLISLVEMAYVTGMAGAAWRKGNATLADGWSALAHRLPAVAGAVVLLLVIGICAAVLASTTFGISLLIYAVLFIYTIAAVVIGERPPVGAISQSVSLAFQNRLPTIGVVAIIVVIAVVGSVLGHLVGNVNEEAGWLVSGLLQQVIVAYATLVVAGEYLNLASSNANSGS